MVDFTKPVIIIGGNPMKIRFNKTTFEMLDFPKHVQIVISLDRTGIGIRCCKSSDEKAAAVPKKSSNNNEYYELYASRFDQLFSEVCSHWEKDKAYALNGRAKSNDSEHLVYFKLCNAEVFVENEVMTENEAEITIAQNRS